MLYNQKYTLIRSKRRTLSLQINKHGELIVRAPMKISVSFIDGFIEEKTDWIQKHQTRVKSEVRSSRKKEYSESEILEMKKELKDYIIPRVAELWQGKNLPNYTNIKITKSEGRWGSCSARNSLCFSYRLAEYTNPPVKGEAAMGGGGLVSENQSKTPLDSPLTGGSKTDFIDAIIIHELAHLREKNHQKPFWNLVYSMMPEYEKVIRNFKNERRVP